MATWNVGRVTGAAGVLAIVLVLGSAFMAPVPPSPDDPASKFLAYYTDHRSILLAQMMVGVVSNIPSLIFGGGLWRILRQEEGGDGFLAPTAVFAFLFAGAVATVATCWPGGVAYVAGNASLDEASARNFSLISILLSPGIFSAFGTFSATAGLVVLRGATFPRWLGWLGVVAGIVGFLAMFSVAKSGLFVPFGPFMFAGLLASCLYILVLSVFIWLRAKPVAA